MWLASWIMRPSPLCPPLAYTLVSRSLGDAHTRRPLRAQYVRVGSLSGCRPNFLMSLPNSGIASAWVIGGSLMPPHAPLTSSYVTVVCIGSPCLQCKHYTTLP